MFHNVSLPTKDQVDTLTFQNLSLRDRAKRFEEALRKSTDDQIVVTAARLGSWKPFTDAVYSLQDALAPYKHIEEDLKSLKEVLEMKNQQIHQQELKISELEKIVSFKFLMEQQKKQLLWLLRVVNVNHHLEFRSPLSVVIRRI